jgi:hypothetical protein
VTIGLQISHIVGWSMAILLLMTIVSVILLDDEDED